MKSATRFPGWGSAQVAVLLNYGVGAGHSSSCLLSGSGIQEQELPLRDPSLEQELVVIQNLMERSTLHPFELGFHVGQTCSVNAFGLLGQAIAASGTARQILSVVAEFLSGHHHFLKIRNSISLKGICTVFDPPEELPQDVVYFVLGRDMGAATVFQKSLLEGQDPMVSEIGFQGGEVPGMALVGAFYNCPVRYYQTHNYLKNPIKSLTLVLPTGNQFLSEVLLKRVRHFFSSRLNESSAADQKGVHHEILSVLDRVGYQDMSKEQMAVHLNISVRTLARYLEKEGTSWRVFFNNLRMEKAKELLKTTASGIEDIALQLGFSSASAFSNAFSRSTGVAPHAYRQSPLSDYHVHY